MLANVGIRNLAAIKAAGGNGILKYAITES